MGYHVSNDKLSGLPNFHRQIGVIIETGKDDGILNDFLLECRRKGKKNFIEEHDQIKNALGVSIFPRVDLVINSDIISINDIENRNDLRAVFAHSSLSRALVKGRVSHLLEGIAKDTISEPIFGSAKFCPQEDDFDLLIEFCSVEDIRNIIVDISYDIQMFYYYGFHVKYDDIDKKQLLSSLKVVFAKKKNLIPEELDVKYISFSSLSRSKDGVVDFPKFIQLWDDFDEFIDTVSEYDRPVDLTNEEIARDIIKTHPQGGQISYKALLSMLNHAKKEKYVLIRTLHAPHSKKERAKLLGMLGAKKWRCGILRLRPFEEQYHWIMYQRYVSVFVVDR